MVLAAEQSNLWGNRSKGQSTVVSQTCQEEFADELGSGREELGLR